jgi:Flp pilus assembly protein TadG
MRVEQHKNASARRRGIATIELILVTPILLFLLLAMIELSLILFVKQQLVAASAQGARVAAQGGSAEEVEAAVRMALRDTRLGHYAEVDAVVTDGTGQPMATGAAVQVNVRVAAADVVPDFLAIIGFSLRKEELISSTLMRKE